MKNEATNKLMSILITISLVIFVIGGIFRIQHWPHGIIIATIGLISYLVLSQVEIKRLRKIIARLSGESEN